MILVLVFFSSSKHNRSLRDGGFKGLCDGERVSEYDDVGDHGEDSAAGGTMGNGEAGRGK